MTCGLFVGMVLGLTGYDLLQRFGSEEALGTAGALAVIKELGRCHCAAVRRPRRYRARFGDRPDARDRSARRRWK